VIDGPTFTIAMTIPDTEFPFEDQKRYELNKMIRQFASQCPDRVVLVDLSSLYDRAQEKNAKYW
jgi:hypothetical protein